MTTAPLTFYERVILWNLCGGHQVANLREAATYIRVIDKLRPQDAEKKESQFKITDRGFNWFLPHDNYGNRVVELEDDEAAALVAVMEAQQNIRVSDAEWMLRLTELLHREPVKA